MRGVLNGLIGETSRIAIVDLEAGLEHLSRGTARHVDILLVVGEPYFKSLEVVVPFDTAVTEADERGAALFEHRPDAPSVAAIRSLANQLLETAH
ncbi:MAG: hypothetical protein C5B48_05995 [Candidatus Rokuibacteriota bacterium]|nr:MAG: hypothetical protein C5B48_05995 [Candidatus Rokubacteria bacterium]